MDFCFRRKERAMNRIRQKFFGVAAILIGTFALSMPVDAQGPRGGGPGGVGGAPRGNFGGPRGGMPSVSRSGIPGRSPAKMDVPSRAPGRSPAKMNVPSRAPGRDPGRVDSPNRAPGRDPGRVDSPNRAPGRDPGRVDSPNRAPGRDPGRVDSPNRAPGRDPGRVDSPNRAPGRDPGRDLGRVDGPGRVPSRDPGRADTMRHPVPIHPGKPHPGFVPSAKPHPGQPHPGHWPGSHSILPPPPSPFFHAPHHRPHYLPYRPYFYDPVHFHAGWHPVYRPYYPWWIVDAATFGAGYAIGYYVRNGEPVYYYYPDETVVDVEPAPAEDVILEEIPLPEETGALAEPEITEAADNSGSVLDESILTPVEGGGQSVIENGGTEAVSALPKVSRSEIDSAWLKIQDGDTAFSKGEMTEAIEKYSQVSEDLPSIPDSWFRLAYAESARGNYGVASEYAVKGMEASKIWPASPFSMDYVYQGANDRKRTNLVALETAARNAPNDGPLNFLAGLSFYSDGQNDKAAKYFKIAEKNSPELKEFTEPMLNEIP